jgi:hypothetical protein
MEAHREHNEKLSKILEHLDPEASTDGMLDVIADRVDETTPGGLATVREDIAKLAGKGKP